MPDVSGRRRRTPRGVERAASTPRSTPSRTPCPSATSSRHRRRRQAGYQWPDDHPEGLKGEEDAAAARLPAHERDDARQMQRAGSAPTRRAGATRTHPARCSRRTRRRGRPRPGDTVKITVAKARPNVPDVTTGNPTADEATQTLEDAGYKVKTPERPDPPSRPRDRPVPRPNTARSTGGDGHHRCRPTRTPTPTPPRPDPNAVRVAVLAGGRSSEHDVSLHSAAAVREGVAAAGHEVLPVTIERSGDWTTAASRWPCGRRRPARRRRRLPGAARPVRRGRHAAGPARASGRALRGRRRARLFAVHGQGGLQGGARRRGRPAGALRGRARARWEAEPDGCCASSPCSARRYSSSPPGWLLRRDRQGVVRVRARSRPGRRLRPRLAGDRRGLQRRHRGRVLGDRPGRARGVGPRGDRPDSAEWYDYEAKYDRRRDVAGDARPAARRCSRRSAGWPSTRSCASAAPASRGWTSSSRRRAGDRQRAQHDAGVHQTSVFPKLWEAAGCAFPDLCDGCWRSRWSASRPGGG